MLRVCCFLLTKVIFDKGDPLRSPLTPLFKGGIIGKEGIFKSGYHLRVATFPWKKLLKNKE